MRDPTRKQDWSQAANGMESKPCQEVEHGPGWRQVRLQFSPGKSWRPRAALKVPGLTGRGPKWWYQVRLGRVIMTC